MSESITQFPAPVFPAGGNSTDYVVATQGSTGPGTGTTRKLLLRQVFQAGAFVFFPQQFGAIADGSSHPASANGFATLAALQAKYSFATALTNEMDWLGTQAAINAAAAAGGGKGGVVVSPPGSYVYTNSNSAADGSGTIAKPNATIYAYDGGVSWYADFPGSVHNWPNDLGTGKFAITCGTRPDGSDIGILSGLRMVGPGAGSTLGSSSVNMQGIATNDRTPLRDLVVSGFWAGCNVIGGQFSHENCNFHDNYYGYYWENPSTANHGNMQFKRILCGANKMAAVGVHHNASIIGSTFMGCFFGTAPFGIYKETNAGSPGNAQVIHSCEFINTQFEEVGNAAISDDQATQANHKAVIYSAYFRNCQFGWDTAMGGNFHLTTRTAMSMIDVHELDMVTFDQVQEPGQFGPATVSTFYADVVSGFQLINTDVETMIANCTGAVSPNVNMMFAGNGWAYNYPKIHHLFGTEWEGTYIFNRDTNGAVGAVLVQAANTADLQSTASAGTTADAVMGIMMYNPTPAAAFSNCIMAYKGDVPVKASGTINIGSYVRTAAAGACIAASNSNDNATSPIFGICMAAASGGSATIRLRGLS